MQRYFVEELKNQKARLSEEDSYHLKVVMRTNIGENVEIVCKNKLYLGVVDDLEQMASIAIKEELNIPDFSYNVTIAQGLIKDKKMDFVLQKATELGVSEIIPLETKRSVVKISGKEEKKIERWQKIVKEASSQSKRIQIPQVKSILCIDDLLKLDYDVKILCSVNETSTSIKKVLEKLNRSDRILFVVGAEGGFEKEEEQKLIQNGFIRVSLGSTVLRTETAPLYLLSVVSYHFMR